MRAIVVVVTIMAVAIRVRDNRSSRKVAMAVKEVVVVNVGRVRIFTFQKEKGIKLLYNGN